MAEINESSQILGVKIVQLRAYTDERGRFWETFRKEWFPERRWEIVQANRSDSRAGVLRGLHYHFEQIDYWYVTSGRIRVGLADLRRSSPTFGQNQVLEMGGEEQKGVFIPCGVAHGFFAITDATLTYLVDNYYNGDDEFGVAWNDPQLALTWGVETPLLSERDRNNPFLRDIPHARLPV
jgi:dTDP-4-dehydrorhamnose 3,5-epimerase